MFLVLFETLCNSITFVNLLWSFVYLYMLTLHDDNDGSKNFNILCTIVCRCLKPAMQIFNNKKKIASHVI